MLKNINNVYNFLVQKGSRAKSLKKKDIIPFGRSNKLYFTGYKPLSIFYEDLVNSLNKDISASGGAPQDLESVLTAGNDSNGNNIDMTGRDKVTFGGPTAYIHQARGDLNYFTEAFHFFRSTLVANQGIMSFNTDDGTFTAINNTNNKSFKVDLPTDTIKLKTGAVGSQGNLSYGSVTLMRTWDLPDASGTIALTSDIPELNKLTNLPTYADNASATGGGLVADDVYKTATGELRIVV